VELERLLTDPQGFGLVTASLPQRAVCRIMTGVPLGDYAKHPDVIAMVGGPEAVARLPNKAPNKVLFGAAVRCAKSTIVAAKAVRNAFLGDCSGLQPGEVPRVPIVSVDLDKAKETFSKLVGALTTSEKLSSLLLKVDRDSVVIKNHSGWPVEIKMIAGSRSGQTLVSRWCLGAIFDEAPRMLGQSDGVINLDDALTAIEARMRPGAQIDLVGSLWAPRGPVYERVQEHFGKPSEEIVVIIATGPMLRPDLYTPEYCERIRNADDRAYETDVMARFADPEDALLPSVDVAACVRRTDAPLEPDHRRSYVAVMDPATRGNGWTLCLIECGEDGRFAVALAKEWIGTRAQPLRPAKVLHEIAEELEPYGVVELHTDQWAFDALMDVAELAETGLMLIPGERDDETDGKRLAKLLSDRALSLPNDRQLRADLISIKRRPRTAGGSQIVLPKTADGRHCDYAAALLLAMHVLPEKPTAPVLDEMTDEERQWCEMVRKRREQGAADRLGGDYEAAWS